MQVIEGVLFFLADRRQVVVIPLRGLLVLAPSQGAQGYFIGKLLRQAYRGYVWICADDKMCDSVMREGWQNIYLKVERTGQGVG